MNQPDLQQALRELQQQHIFLRPAGRTIEMWSPGARVSERLRRVVRKHRREVLQLLDLSEISTCPNPDLHRAEWDYELKRWCCNVCARLKAHVS